MYRHRLVFGLLVGLCSALTLTGCKKNMVGAPDYSRQLPPGTNALRKITDPSQRPDLVAAFAGRDAGLTTALDRSIGWYARPSSKVHFPVADIPHDQAQASAYAFRQMLAASQTGEEFRDRVYAEFDAYISVGWDMQGTVLYTGYYSPIFDASAVRTSEFQYPLYKRPADLVADPVTGDVMGRRVGNTLTPYPARTEIERSNMLAGTEHVWLRDRLDAYIIQVNGSARLTMTDGTTRYVGYAGNNGHEYVSIGRLMVEEGKLEKNKVSLPAIRAYFQQNPGELQGYIDRNPRFVFFQDYGPDVWPAGSLGVKVTDFRSLATDKTLFPRAAVTLVQTSVPASGGGELRRFDQFMLDQDTGGAIRAAGRGDIYMGVGPQAEAIAGRQFAEGRLYYFFLKPERVAEWLNAARSAGRGPM